MRQKTVSQTGVCSRVTNAIGEEPFEGAYYRKNDGTLSQSDETWAEFDRLSDLPSTDLDGWEELFVYTDQNVYHWVEAGYDAGPTVLPRDPQSLAESM